MRHIAFQESNSYPVALLFKPSALLKQAIISNYIEPLNKLGVPETEVIAFDVFYNSNGKVTMKEAKEYLQKLLTALDSLGTTLIYVTDGTYFKALTKQTKAEVHLGYVLPCAVKGFEHISVVYGINYQVLIFNPDQQEKLTLSLSTLASYKQGNYVALGGDIIHSAEYPQTLKQIEEALSKLHKYPRLTVDIEAFSLRFWEAGIASIAFAWDKHNGIAFLCDWTPGTLFADNPSNQPNVDVRNLIRKFLSTYAGELVFHNAGYDVKVLIYTLWMRDPLDYEGMLKGLHTMYPKSICTRIMAYLATNSTAGNILALKSLAHEFAGNWAIEEIEDVLQMTQTVLLQYNLIDALSTFYVYEKMKPIVVADQQEEFFQTMAMPSQKVITQIELVGMPMSWQQLQSTEEALMQMQADALNTINASPVIALVNMELQVAAQAAVNAKLKTKQHPLSKFQDVRFTPSSGKHMQKLLYEVLGLPVIDYTDTKQPAVGADTLDKLINHCRDENHKEVLKAIITFGKAEKILNTFISAFKQGLVKADGTIYLHGSFMFGGTVSGRLSSKEPNLQNIPSNSTLAKYVKQCFMPPRGWLFCGADFASLEDKINTLLTKDPNKIKVYTDNYDGHALRAYAYFGDQMPTIVNTVESINSIAVKSSPYYSLRQDSKSPTFALTYAGTWRTLVKNLGWPEDKAKRVEESYQQLYQVSIKWVQDKIQQASKDGYATSAFGLRIRTPLLKQSIMGGSIREAEAEARTLGNAISGQSYGLLNNRAINAFMEKVWESPYKYSIVPCALIHDAIYLLVKDDVDVVKFVNDNLIKEMQWQELPEIAHDQVKLGAELDIFWPSWANPITLPNGLSVEEIQTVCTKAKEKYENKL